MSESSSNKSSVCGFSFGKNLTKLSYPVEAAVKSVLPICDRFVFVVGKSDDDTRARIESLGPKVEIIDSVWPDVKVDGTVLAIEANKAMGAAEATGCTWGFYIQADEVVHEDDLPIIRHAMNRWKDESRVKALLFRYMHFALDYQTTDPWMYHKASRIVRLDKTCDIVGDACGPAIRNYTGNVHKGNGYLDKHHLGGHVQWAADASGRKARIFHYGWVKTREQLAEKLKMVEELWRGGLDSSRQEQSKNDFFAQFIRNYPTLKKFHGSHPRVMADLVSKHPVFDKVPPRWLNPKFYARVLRHGFHG